jgi:UDP-N-acetylglucosamine--N-acetylmuramyl-(pentapeptide) pyrophosphoryl-undecaprenol N-acetylglucosamine transferase
VLYGSERAGEREWVAEGAEPVALDSPLLPARGRDVPRFCARLMRAVLRSLRDMQRRRPDLVVGLGGYASVAPGIAALVSHRPLLLLEQNVVPGKANRLLARLGGRVAASYAESLGLLPGGARSRSRVVGNPVRPELLEGRRDPQRFGLGPGRPVLLVAGGSQGAAGLNERVSSSAAAIARRGVQVLHLTGPRDLETVRARYRRAGVQSYTAAFSHEMGHLYRTADLVLCRAGGTTLAELTLLGRPSVLVPYPHHADRHQERNARILVAQGAARLVPEAELTEERLEREVLDLVENEEVLLGMGRAARGLAVPDAALRAAAWARELMEGGG